MHECKSLCVGYPLSTANTAVLLVCWSAPYVIYTEGYFVATSSAIYEALRVRNRCYLILQFID